MMSSVATSSPVSASTLAYLMRWPVLRLIWLKLTFSVSDVAGYRATGQVTSERRKKPFQLARGAMGYSETRHTTGDNTTGEPGFKLTGAGNLLTALTVAGRFRCLRGGMSPPPSVAPRRGKPQIRNIVRHRTLLSTPRAARR